MTGFSKIVERIKAGNTYVNRNQIGAVVGSQPFGGEGLSGTGPKAGGPNYVSRFTQPERSEILATSGPSVGIQTAIDGIAARELSPISTQALPGVTGESNRFSIYPRGLDSLFRARRKICQNATKPGIISGL